MPIPTIVTPSARDVCRSRRPVATFLALGSMALLAFAPTAAAATNVSISGSAFVPAVVTVPQRATVSWSNDDPFTHSVKSDPPLTYWPEAVIDPPDPNFNKVFTAAGTFPYRCGIHDFMRGRVRVRLKVDAVGRDFTITAGSQPFTAPNPFRFVVQRRNPGSSTWVTIATTRSATMQYHGPVAGEYVFRSAVRRASNGAMSGWSKIVRKTVA